MYHRNRRNTYRKRRCSRRAGSRKHRFFTRKGPRRVPLRGGGYLGYEIPETAIRDHHSMDDDMFYAVRLVKQGDTKALESERA